MANYNPSTIARIADIHEGIGVDTSVLNSATYIVNGTQTELFTVKGLIKLTMMFVEIVVDCSAHAAQLDFNCTFSSPVIAVNPMGVKCAALTSLGQGGRIWWGGGAVTTAAVITDSAGLTVAATDVIPQLVGGKDFVGSIGILGSDASLTAGTFFCHLRYVPILEGSYVEAKL